MSKRVNVDVCNADRISGWAIDDENPQQRIELDLIVDGKFQITIFSYNQREDLLKSGIGDGKCAFKYNFSKLVRSKGRATISLVESKTQKEFFSQEILFSELINK